MPDLKLDKDGKITAVMPAAAGGHGEEGGRQRRLLLRHRPALVVNFEDGSVVRFLQITME
jgi:hypothetical protein